MRKVLKLILVAFVFLLVFILGTNLWVIGSTADSVYDVQNCPSKKVALVLGTSKRTSSGNPNRFFEERMLTAAELYLAGNVRHILVSGDNRSRYYNEPRDMLQALGDLNVPDSAITLDFAGLRTFDSVVRSKKVFKQQDIAIVTQRFHCYRSLFIARYYGLDAVAVAADENEFIGTSLAIREVFARTMAILDLYVLESEPTYLGEEEPIKLTN